MSKKKILFIMHMPPPVHGAAVMGKYIHDSPLINGKYDCVYINPTMAKDLKDIAKISLRKFFGFFFLLKRVYSSIRTIKPVICYFTPASGRKGFYKSFIIVLLLKLLRQKIVLHFHNKGLVERQNEFIDNFLFKIFFKNVQVILLSELLYDEVRKYLPKKNLYICPNGIPSSGKIISAREKNASKVFTILFLSNMMEEKGVWVLLEACDILARNGYSFKCNFVGKWSDIDESSFLEKVNALSLNDKVFAHGPKYETDKDAFFQEADLFAFPTYYKNETFGLVLLEAMEYGIPCISTFEGGIPSVVKDGKTGLLIPSKNPVILADRMMRMIDNPNLCKEMGDAGRERFHRHFTIDKFEMRMSDILKTIIEKAQ